MRLLRIFVARLRGMLLKGRLDEELNEELRFHLEMATEENLRRGMSPGEARRAARLSFGGVEQVKESYRDRRGLPVVETFLRDLGYGFRMLRRNPGFAAVAVLTLAIGIGANTAIFSVINAVLLRPLPYPGSNRLVVLYNSYVKIIPDLASYGYCCNSGPDYPERREETEVFESVTMLAFQGHSVGSRGSPQRVTGARVTPSFFTVLETQPQLGRAFSEAEAVPGNENVAILSHGLWQQIFAGSSSVVGSSVRIDGIPHEIVGVMPEGFDVFSRDPRLFVPLVFTERQKTNRHGNFAYMLARLNPGVSIEVAQERMKALDARNLERSPNYTEFIERTGFATVVNDLHDEMVQTARPKLYLLQVGVAFVLLIGCVNIANLLLIRSAGRARELAVRFALGAGRWRVTRQLLTESLLLALFGGASGLLVGIAGMPVLSWLGVEGLPRASGIGIDTKVVVFTMLTAVATSVIFGTIAAMHVSRGNLYEALRQGGWSGTSGRSKSLTRGALVVAEVSLTFVLLIGTGLVVASFAHVLSVDPGFRPDRVLTARISLPDGRYGGDDEIRTFTARLEETAAALPGVRSVGVTTLLPLSGDKNKSTVTVEGYTLAAGESAPTPNNSWVTGGYFAALGIPLLEGRLFNDSDSADSPLVAIADREFARKYWPNESPIGKRIHRGGGAGMWLNVVGVVDAIKMDDLAEQGQRGTVYFAQKQPSGGVYRPLRREMSLVVRADAPETLLVDPVRKAILALDPELPLYDIKSLDARLGESLLARRATMTLLLVFAGVALLLSAIGVYGVLSHSVSQRTREIGIQMALGAGPGEVLRRVLWQGVKLLLLGLVVGLVGAFWLTRMIASQLHGVEPTDPAVIGLVTCVLALVTVAACWIPARRATRVNVVAALRCE
jgi:predicted permease